MITWVVLRPLRVPVDEDQDPEQDAKPVAG